VQLVQAVVKIQHEAWRSMGKFCQMFHYKSALYRNCERPFPGIAKIYDDPTTSIIGWRLSIILKQGTAGICVYL